MRPELFHIPYFGWAVHSYGAMLVIGFFLALQLARFLARRRGLDPEAFVNAGLVALVTGIIGARLSHVVENWSDYTRADLSFGQNLWNAVNLTSGGLTYYGGFLLAFPCTVLYGLSARIPIRIGMDIIAPCLMIGLGFGRVGCFLNGCCYGAECDLPAPFGVEYPYGSNAYVDQFAEGHLPHRPPEELTEDTAHGERLKSAEQVARDAELRPLAAAEHSHPVHNAQIYSFVTGLLLAALLTAYFTLPHAPGRVFAVMMVLEGGTRFLLEMLRAEPAVIGPFSISMVIGMSLVIGGLLLWFIFGRQRDADESLTTNPAPAA